MVGHGYSWHTINKLLQDRLDDNRLEFTLKDGDVIFEWNNLCEEKRLWDKTGRLSVRSAEFNRDFLINLKILPARGGLENEGKPNWLVKINMLIVTGPRLVTNNSDEPGLLTKDLGVEPPWEGFFSDGSADSLYRTDGSSQDDREGSEYEEDEYETEAYAGSEVAIEGGDRSPSSSLTQEESEGEESLLDRGDDEYKPSTPSESPYDESQEDLALLLSPLKLDDSEGSNGEKHDNSPDITEGEVEENTSRSVQ
jgi:hypothetical protein